MDNPSILTGFSLSFSRNVGIWCLAAFFPGICSRRDFTEMIIKNRTFIIIMI